MALESLLALTAKRKEEPKNEASLVDALQKKVTEAKDAAAAAEANAAEQEREGIATSEFKDTVEKPDPLEAIFNNSEAKPEMRIRAAQSSGSLAAKETLKKMVYGHMNLTPSERVLAASALMNTKYKDGEAIMGFIELQKMAKGEMDDFPSDFSIRLLAAKAYLNAFKPHAIEIIQAMAENEPSPTDKIEACRVLIAEDYPHIATITLADIATDPNLDEKDRNEAQDLIVDSVKNGVTFPILANMSDRFEGIGVHARQIGAARIIASYDPESAAKLVTKMLEETVMSKADIVEAMSVLTETGKKEWAISRLVMIAENNLGSYPFYLRRQAVLAVALTDGEEGKRALTLMRMMLHPASKLSPPEKRTLIDDIGIYYPNSPKTPLSPYKIDSKKGKIYYESRADEIPENS